MRGPVANLPKNHPENKMKTLVSNIVSSWRVLVAGVVGILVEKFGLPQAVVDGTVALYVFLFG
jgi:hypothetical protein